MNVYLIQKFKVHGLPDHRLYAVITEAPDGTTLDDAMFEIERLGLAPLGVENIDWFLITDDEYSEAEYPRRVTTKTYAWRDMERSSTRWYYARINMKDNERRAIDAAAHTVGESRSEFMRNAAFRRIEREGIAVLTPW